jgi:hypothetical protein
MNLKSRYGQHIITIILAQKEYGFTEVNEVQSLKYLRFDYEYYPLANQLIEQGHWEQIHGQEQTISEFREYLEIVRFKDQTGKTFIATIYDSDALEQDPQIIDIFSI